MTQGRGRTGRTRNRALGAALAGILLVSACTDSQDPDTETAPRTAGPEGAAGTAPGPPRLPDGALGEQSQWVLDLLDPAASGPTAQEAKEHFSAEFLEQVPAGDLEPVLADVRETGPPQLVEVGPPTEQDGGGSSTTLRLAGAEPLLVRIAVDPDGLIAGLQLQPDTSATAPEVASWQDLDSQFADLGGTTRVYVGEVADGSCSTVHTSSGSDAMEPAPSGSVFKLIVLSAVVDAVAAGDLAWDQELTITPELKSLPTGELQDREDGSKVTVREAAGLMISISDNTATDLLMHAVGVEQLTGVVDQVVTDPARLTPMLTTRQLFLLGWDAPQIREQWSGAPPEQRTDLLAQLPDDLSGVGQFEVSTPAWPDDVGWFLTGQEICTAHARLQQQADTEAGAPVREILSANPGLTPPHGVAYQGFKGGSAPGVLAFSFYLETPADQDRGTGRVLSVQVANEGGIMPGPFQGLTQAGLALLTEDQD